MPEIYAVVQCQNRGAVPEVDGRPVEVRTALNVMTNGFRIVFGQVFESVWELDGCPPQIEWLDQHASVAGAWVAHTDRSRLQGLEGDLWVLVVRLLVDGDADGVRDLMTSARASRGVGTDGAVYRELLDALGDCPAVRLFSALEFSVPDIKLSTIQPSEEVRDAAPMLVAFYYLGLMTVHRIDRDQVRLEMPVEPGQLDDATAEFIARTRVRLANVNRYFLTTNRSQIPDARQVCERLVERTALSSRYERQVAIHRDMERHLDNIAQIAQVRSSQETQAVSERTNSVLFYLTVIGLPLAVFSAVMTFSLDAPLISQPDRWPTWATFLVALGASATASLILLAVALMVASNRRRDYKTSGRPKVPGGS